MKTKDIRYAKGARVSGTFYGKLRTGTVQRHELGSIVWVHWDDRPNQIAQWCHAESLNLSK